MACDVWVSLAARCVCFRQIAACRTPCPVRLARHYSTTLSLVLIQGCCGRNVLALAILSLRPRQVRFSPILSWCSSPYHSPFCFYRECFFRTTYYFHVPYACLHSTFTAPAQRLASTQAALNQCCHLCLGAACMPPACCLGAPKPFPSRLARIFFRPCRGFFVSLQNVTKTVNTT